MKTRRQIAIERLDADDREYFEERAAIREFHGEQERHEAEKHALMETKLRDRAIDRCWRRGSRNTAQAT